MRSYLWCALLLLVVAPARAEAPPQTVKDVWDMVTVHGTRCGYFHTTVQEMERDGKKLYRTTLEMNLLVKRYNAVIPLRIEMSTDETADGKVVALSLTQFLDKGNRVVQTGTVQRG